MIAEKEVQIGERMNITESISDAANMGREKVGMVVLGPGRLCDDVRAAVTAAARQSTDTVFESEVEAYSW